jgi:hypothetical protein
LALDEARNRKGGMVDKYFGKACLIFSHILMLCGVFGTGPMVFSAEMLRDIVCHMNGVLLDFLKGWAETAGFCPRIRFRDRSRAMLFRAFSDF